MMEKKLYNDDFEQFLRETTDNFRMYPSKRVWNSIYNNLHPGRKWPSLIVSMLLISSMIFIGIAHKNEIAATSATVLAKIDPATSEPGVKGQMNIPANISLDAGTTRFDAETFKRNSIDGKITPEKAHTLHAGPVTTKMPLAYRNQIPVAESLASNIVSSSSKNEIISSKGTKTGSSTISNSTVSDEILSLVQKEEKLIALNNEIAVPVYLNDENNAETEKTNALNAEILKVSVEKNRRKEQKEWMEDFAFHNQLKPLTKTRLSSQLYITPSIGFRTLIKNTSPDVSSRSVLLANANIVDAGINHSVTQNATLNFEAGYSLIYAHSKSIRLKTGIQFNFTNYRIHAHDLGHTTYTTLLLNDSYSNNGATISPRNSTLANLPGSASGKKLNNSTFQVSIPIGADIKILGNDRIQWFAGATIQPTYVLFGNAYLISSDLKNYVYDPSFIRNWNFNTGIETFISYKNKNGVVFNAGPQFRYQFLSTYNKSYSYTEKLYNVGLKIGMTRNF